MKAAESGHIYILLRGGSLHLFTHTCNSHLTPLMYDLIHKSLNVLLILRPPSIYLQNGSFNAAPLHRCVSSDFI